MIETRRLKNIVIFIQINNSNSLFLIKISWIVLVLNPDKIEVGYVRVKNSKS